jgi:hypothetical protein
MSKLQIHKIWMNRRHEKDLKLPRATVYLIIQILQKITGTGPSAQRRLIPLQASDGEGPVCHFILLALPTKPRILCLDSL